MKNRVRNVCRHTYAPDFLLRFGNSGYAHIDFRNFIPGGIIHNTGCGQSEYPLEGAYRIGSAASEDTVLCNPGDGGIILCDAVELLLHLQNLLPRRADGKIIAWP